jgi:hypothetical protein
MAGYVTQTRSSYPYDGTVDLYGSAGTLVDRSTFNGTYLQPCTETVTSWRTRVPESTDGDPTTATSSLDFIKKLGDERRHQDSPYDTGHTFSSRKRKMFLSHPHVDTGTKPATGGYRYVGPLIASPQYNNPSAGTWAGMPGFSDGVYATQAIARTTPTNSVANLAVALAELYRDGLPRLIGSTVLHGGLNPWSLIQGLGEEYLNFVFGYEPTARDLADAAYAVTNARDIVRQYMRDSGRPVRRSYSFPEEHTVTAVDGGNNFIVYGSIWPNAFQGSATGRITTVTETHRKVWFKGCYTYYVPVTSERFGQLNKFASLAQKLTGVGVSPEAIWNAAPWSWLADWFVDIGDIIHNLDAFRTDGLILKYGYLMCETTTRVTCTHSGVTYNSGISSGLITTVWEETLKQRFKATPYGFGLDPSTFSGQQWSILGALGMTRGPRSLR